MTLANAARLLAAARTLIVAPETIPENSARRITAKRDVLVAEQFRLYECFGKSSTRFFVHPSRNCAKSRYMRVRTAPRP